MRFQRLTNYLLSHRWQALLLTFLLTYIPLLGMASILIAGLFTLCVGVFEGALFTISASLVYLLVFLSGSQEAVPMIIWATVVITISGNVLTWVFAVMLRRQCTWSFILQMAALFGVLVISIIHLAYPNIDQWWSVQLQAFYNQTTELAAIATPDKLQPLGQTQIDTINVIKNYATGIVVTFILFSALVQVAVSRWWQMAVVKHARMGRELHFVHLTRLAGILFVLSIVLYYLENRVVLDILPVLCLLFGAAGLSLVHYLCSLLNPSQSRLWLSILYVALMCSLVMMAMLPLFATLNAILPVVIAVLLLLTCVFIFVLLGLLDVWLDVRKRIQKV